MPKTIANFKCKLCGDIFTAMSDKYYSCKCGMSEVKPEKYCTSYVRDKYNFERLQDGKDHTYYSKEDFHILKGETLDLYNQMKSLCKELDFYVYESFRSLEDGTDCLYHVSCGNSESISSHSEEINEIEFDYWLSKEMCHNFKEDIFKNNLLRFIKFLNKLKNGEIKISDRKALLADDDLEWEREQLKLYDYKFIF